MATFADNLSALALAAGFSLPLIEAQLGIEKLVFINAETGARLKVEASANNMSSRFLMELILREFYVGSGRTSYVHDLARLRPLAEKFYAEHWNDKPGTGKHPIIDGFRYYTAVEATWMPCLRDSAPVSLDDLIRRVQTG